MKNIANMRNLSFEDLVIWADKGKIKVSQADSTTPNNGDAMDT